LIEFGTYTQIKKSRKAHKCDECDRTIPVGSTYDYFSGGGEGRCWTFKTCLSCANLRRFLESKNWDFDDDRCGESLQDAAAYHAISSPDAKGPACDITSEFPQLGRDNQGFWVVASEAEIFVDLDGVLANFLKGACFRHQRPYRPHELNQFLIAKHWGISSNEFWAALVGREFWETLEPYSWAREFFEALEKIAPTKILSAPCQDSECIPGKTAWLNRELGLSEDRMIFSRKKHEWAKHRRCVLIDDRKENCDRFAKAGGTAILFPQPWNMPGHCEKWQDWGHVVNLVRGICR
jgi:hypothetical protein